jgi:hypothetical protein
MIITFVSSAVCTFLYSLDVSLLSLTFSCLFLSIGRKNGYWVDVCLLVIEAVWTGRQTPRFWRNTGLLCPSIVMKKEAVYCLKTLVSTYQSTRRHKAEDRHRYSHTPDLRSHGYPVNLFACLKLLLCSRLLTVALCLPDIYIIQI